MLERVWRRGKPSYIVGGSGNWCSHCGKQYGSSSKKVKTEFPCGPTIPVPSIHLEKTLYLEMIHAPLCL